MIGYRIEKSKMDEYSPSELLTCEVINQGNVWILEELLSKLERELDAKTKYQAKIFLNSIEDGTIPVCDENSDNTRYLLLFEKIVDALSKHLGFEVKCLTWLSNLDTAFDLAVECTTAYQTGVEVACEGSNILYAYDVIPSPLEDVEYQLLYLNKAGDTIIKDKFDSFEKMRKLASDVISSYEHYGTDNVHALMISDGESDFIIWTKELEVEE